MTPQFPFGHGLTYGRVQFSELRVTPERCRREDQIEVRLKARNIGRGVAHDTVFLFAHDKLASVSRPVLELKGWQQYRLRPGEATEINLRLAARELQFLDASLEPTFERGEVELLAGPVPIDANCCAPRCD